MSKHYSRIVQASRYQLALESYVAYIEGKANRQPNIGSGRTRDASQTLFVTPFSVNLGSTVKLQVSASQPAWAEHEGAFGDHTVAVLPGGDTSVRLRGVKAARVTIVTGRKTKPDVDESHITKMKYLNYGGTSRSIPFGRAAAGDTEVAVFETIKGLIAPPGSATRVYLTSEVA